LPGRFQTRRRAMKQAWRWRSGLEAAGATKAAAR
jgi:hypothetical protein